MSEEEPVVLPLADCDSSTEGDSSGNDSSTRVEVRRRHRIPKRMSRNDRYWRRKRERRRIRNAEVEEKIEIQEQIGQRRDYIIMEYLQNGSLAGLIVKLNELKADKIPNRVLWGFWLCRKYLEESNKKWGSQWSHIKTVIRACIAMEYPPRKFHPLRNKPQSPEGAVPFLQAKANNMIRECKRLGIRLFDPQEYARMEAQYNQLEGDLVENLPNPTEKESLNWKRERRQNMVHRDLDPTNSLSIHQILHRICWQHQSFRRWFRTWWARSDTLARDIKQFFKYKRVHGQTTRSASPRAWAYTEIESMLT